MSTKEVKKQEIAPAFIILHFLFCNNLKHFAGVSGWSQLLRCRYIDFAVYVLTKPFNVIPDIVTRKARKAYPVVGP